MAIVRVMTGHYILCNAVQICIKTGDKVMGSKVGFVEAM